MLPLPDRIQQANSLLSPLAVPHDGRRGRGVDEVDDLIRFPFERDRQRIVHSTAFRRLQGKTQVFTPSEGDHFRTRLTHTMEVAQISRSLARVLQLNEDVAECIALAHDLGHPPFGHSGEKAIDTWMQEHGRRFEHNLQSYRIVTVLEHRSAQYEGLNVNYEVSDALLKHQTTHPITNAPLQLCLEASVTDLADECAYSAHDIEDGLNAGIFSHDDVRKISIAAEALEHASVHGTGLAGALLHLLVADIVETSGGGSTGVRFSPRIRSALHELRSFLETAMYMHPLVHEHSVNGAKIVDQLCRVYVEQPHEKIIALEQRTGSDRIDAIKDYVAGMTDEYAREQLQISSYL
jgi:dGTPase